MKGIKNIYIPFIPSIPVNFLCPIHPLPNSYFGRVGCIYRAHGVNDLDTRWRGDFTFEFIVRQRRAEDRRDSPQAVYSDRLTWLPAWSLVTLVEPRGA
jgi:hypothetical protein